MHGQYHRAGRLPRPAAREPPAPPRGTSRRGAPVKRLIVTADDFGLCQPVNEAVEIAHREGILTTASLMGGGGAADDALARARPLPRPPVGPHAGRGEGPP